MKDNEIAGVGNWYTALFWEYGTREAVRKNPDPVRNPSVSPYAVFDGNPIYNKDPLGNVVKPWWLFSGPNDLIPGAGGGMQSPYKSFVSGAQLDEFTTAAIGLYKSNDIFKQTYDRLKASKTAYSVQQRAERSLTIGASYDHDAKTVNIMYDGVDKRDLFEEVFHAGQDDYYSSRGGRPGQLALEVEAKAARIVSGYGDDAIDRKKDYGQIREFFKTGKKGKDFDAQVNGLVKDVYDLYSQTNGKDWADKNKPSDLNKDKLFNYLQTVTVDKGSDHK